MINRIVSRKHRPPLPLLLLVFLVLPSCAVQHPIPQHETPVPIERPEIPTPIERPEKPVTQQPSAPAGPAHTLYAKANESLASGHPDQAEMLLERALRIEPRNALYWHLLAQSKYAQGDFGQTVQFCRKSESLAGNNSTLRQGNRNLMQQALQKTGGH
jgi:predicted Zn-dependent protease